MRALICSAFASLDDVRFGELPTPTPGPGEVLVRVAAAGVNFYDTLIVQGKYQIKPPLPFSPGGESAGVVAAVGAGVTRVRPGDRVVAFSHYGAFAEYCLAPERQTFPLPEGVSFDQAAAALVAYGTAWFALYDRGRMRPGETVLVLGAAGGVGLAAVQIAHRAGARVIAAASSPEKLALCAAAGADLCIDYSQGELKALFKQSVGPKGADIVIDVVGNPYSEAALRAMGWRGRLMIIGFAAGEIPRLPANLMLLKGCEVSGVLWDGLLAEDPEPARQQVADLLAAIADGSLQPRITETFPLESGLAALKTLAERRVTGKVIVCP
ncbi:MAG: hypothetical protein RIR00_2058 [Pseudomonadota bacterium]|jgi:NADPH2:quinone reductase